MNGIMALWSITVAMLAFGGGEWAVSGAWLVAGVILAMGEKG